MFGTMQIIFERYSVYSLKTVLTILLKGNIVPLNTYSN